MNITTSPRLNYIDATYSETNLNLVVANGADTNDAQQRTNNFFLPHSDGCTIVHLHTSILSL